MTTQLVGTDIYFICFEILPNLLKSPNSQSKDKQNFK